MTSLWIQMAPLRFPELEPEDDAQGLEGTPRNLQRRCPECRGSCEDKHGDPCEWCHGEGEI